MSQSFSKVSQGGVASLLEAVNCRDATQRFPARRCQRLTYAASVSAAVGTLLLTNVRIPASKARSCGEVPVPSVRVAFHRSFATAAAVRPPVQAEHQPHSILVTTLGRTSTVCAAQRQRHER